MLRELGAKPISQLLDVFLQPTELRVLLVGCEELEKLFARREQSCTLLHAPSYRQRFFSNPQRSRTGAAGRASVTNVVMRGGIRPLT